MAEVFEFALGNARGLGAMGSLEEFRELTGPEEAPRSWPGGPDPSVRERHESEAEVVEALRGGDEEAFASLVRRHYASMLQFALSHVSNRAVAEDVVQETWVAVLQGLEQFEGRSALRTWIFRILLNRARTSARRENRAMPFSAAGAPPDDGVPEPAVDPDRFLGGEAPGSARRWRTPPQRWGESPEDRLLSAEMQRHIRGVIDGLPPRQREVIALRDMGGWSAAEVCDLLAISDANQRVLLHRARARVRQALERYFAER